MQKERCEPQIARLVTTFRKGSGSGDVGCVEVALAITGCGGR